MGVSDGSRHDTARTDGTESETWFERTAFGWAGSSPCSIMCSRRARGARDAAFHGADRDAGVGGDDIVGLPLDHGEQERFTLALCQLLEGAHEFAHDQTAFLMRRMGQRLRDGPCPREPSAAGVADRR